MPGDHPYLKEGPKCLLISCDVLLGLDDGTKLPVHSHVLARCSSPFANMLDDGPLSSASPANKITVPFEDCSREEADSFLSAVYSLTPQEHIEEASALSIARLGHKYGLKVTAPPLTFQTGHEPLRWKSEGMDMILSCRAYPA